MEVQALRDMASEVAGPARGARGYLAGFGTSGSLLAVAVLLFVVGSAMVAFHGWPHVGAPPSPGEVVISQRPLAAASPASRRLVLFAAPAALATGVGGPPSGGAARGVAAGPGVGRAGGAAPQNSLGRPVSVSSPGGSPAGGGGSASSCGAAGCSSSPAPPRPGGSGSGPTQPLQQVIKQTTSAVGGVVSGTGRQVGSVVQQSTGAVAGVLRPVSPQAAGAVSHAGAGAAQTVTGVTKSVAGALSGLTNP